MINIIITYYFINNGQKVFIIITVIVYSNSLLSFIIVIGYYLFNQNRYFISFIAINFKYEINFSCFYLIKHCYIIIINFYSHLIKINLMFLIFINNDLNFIKIKNENENDHDFNQIIKELINDVFVLVKKKKITYNLYYFIIIKNQYFNQEYYFIAISITYYKNFYLFLLKFIFAIINLEQVFNLDIINLIKLVLNVYGLYFNYSYHYYNFYYNIYHSCYSLLSQYHS